MLRAARQHHRQHRASQVATARSRRLVSSLIRPLPEYYRQPRGLLRRSRRNLQVVLPQVMGPLIGGRQACMGPPAHRIVAVLATVRMRSLLPLGQRHAMNHRAAQGATWQQQLGRATPQGTLPFMRRTLLHLASQRRRACRAGSPRESPGPPRSRRSMWRLREAACRGLRAVPWNSSAQPLIVMAVVAVGVDLVREFRVPALARPHPHAQSPPLPAPLVKRQGPSRSRRSLTIIGSSRPRQEAGSALRLLPFPNSSSRLRLATRKGKIQMSSSSPRPPVARARTTEGTGRTRNGVMRRAGAPEAGCRPFRTEGAGFPGTNTAPTLACPRR